MYVGLWGRRGSYASGQAPMHVLNSVSQPQLSVEAPARQSVSQTIISAAHESVHERLPAPLPPPLLPPSSSSLHDKFVHTGLLL